MFAISVVSFLFTKEVKGKYSEYVMISMIFTMVMAMVPCYFTIMALNGFTRATTLAPVMWRNIRESADDETVYESIALIKSMNKLIAKSRNNLEYASRILMIIMALVAITQAVNMLSQMGYI